ncbi:hypothetical protein PV326_013522, partial [Microctonus aethiopoides]
SKKLLKSLQIDEDGNLLENTQKAFPHDIISRRVSNMHNINDDIILDLSGESSSRHDTNDTPQIISNIQTVEENDTLPKNLFWIPEVTESQIAWQKRILDSMITSYNQQKAKGFRMEVTEIEKELFTEREDKVKIAPDWGCYIRKGSWLHQILGRHNAGNWTKIVLEIMIEIYGSGNLKYMSAKGTRNTIGVNQNLRCAIMDLLLKMNVNTTEKQLTTVINKFCSNRKSAKRPVTNTSMEGRDAMPRAKRHAPSTRVTVEHGGPSTSRPVTYGGSSPSQSMQFDGQRDGNNLDVNSMNQNHIVYASFDKNDCFSGYNYSIPHAVSMSTSII